MKRILLSGVLALGLGLVGLVPAGAATSTVTITPAQLLSNTAPTAMNQFIAINQSGGGGSVGIVNGPAPTPLGVGSLQLAVTAPADHWSVYNYDHMGTLLSSITTLGYSTYTDNATTAPTLQIEINPGNATGLDAGVTYSTINFEPYMNGTVTPGAWQSWNVLNGVVWGTHLTGAPQGAPVSWSTFLADYPNATIKYGFGVNVGSGWSAMTGNVDALTIGTSSATTTYDFETMVAGVSGNRPFASAGAGVETPATAGCQFTPAGCTVTTSGVAHSLHLGRGAYTSTLTIDWALATPNGAGGYCTPASGSGTLTAANGDTLTQAEAGTVCEVGATGLDVAHTFTGTFANTGGTGRFAGATGVGTITGGDDGSGNAYFNETGSIGY